MTKPLSLTQTQILTAAAEQEEQLAIAPAGLPAAARNAVFRSMLGAGLLEEVPAPTEHPGFAWRQGEDGAALALRITEAGRTAVGLRAVVSPVEEAGPPRPAQRRHGRAVGLGRR